MDVFDLYLSYVSLAEWLWGFSKQWVAAVPAVTARHRADLRAAGVASAL
jgi:hypothetical protein